jgi:hypothetical protein
MGTQDREFFEFLAEQDEARRKMKEKHMDGIDERDKARISITHLPLVIVIKASVGVNDEGDVVYTTFHGEQIGIYQPKKDGSPATKPAEAIHPGPEVLDRVGANAAGLVRHVIVTAADNLVGRLPNREQEEKVIINAVEETAASGLGDPSRST